VIIAIINNIAKSNNILTALCVKGDALVTTCEDQTLDRSNITLVYLR